MNTIGYDSKGNVTSHGTYGFAYSSENLLTSFTNSATGAVQASSTFAYDPLMRLAVIDSSNSAFDASLGYDGREIVFEALSSSRTRRYIFVSVDGLAEAMRLLENRTILPITSRTAKRIAGSVPPGSGKLYLVRSGIFAQPGATPARFLLEARNVSYRRIHWHAEKRVLIPFTVQTNDAQLDIFPTPLIARLSVTPLQVRSVCWVVH